MNIRLEKRAQPNKDLEISVVDPSTVAIIHSIYELMKITPSFVLLQFPLLGLSYGSNPRIALVQEQRKTDTIRGKKNKRTIETLTYGFSQRLTGWNSIFLIFRDNKIQHSLGYASRFNLNDKLIQKREKSELAAAKIKQGGRVMDRYLTILSNSSPPLTSSRTIQILVLLAITCPYHHHTERVYTVRLLTHIERSNKIKSLLAFSYLNDFDHIWMFNQFHCRYFSFKLHQEKQTYISSRS